MERVGCNGTAAAIMLLAALAGCFRQAGARVPASPIVSGALSAGLFRTLHSDAPNSPEKIFAFTLEH